MRSYWILEGPKSNDWSLYKRKEREIWRRTRIHTHTPDKEDGHVTMGAEFLASGGYLQSQTFLGRQKLGKGWEEFFFWSLRMAPPTPWFQAFNFQNPGRLFVILSSAFKVLCYDSPRKWIQTLRKAKILMYLSCFGWKCYSAPVSFPFSILGSGKITLLLCLVPCDRVTNTSPFAQDLVLALKVLCPGNSFRPGQAGTFGGSIWKALPCFMADGSLQAEALPRSAVGPEG